MEWQYAATRVHAVPDDVLRAASAVTIAVVDTGVGIALEDQGRIFERSERVGSGRRPSGLGLGLYIVRELVQAHGGSVRVVSAPGAGSTFSVELPLAGPTEEGSQEC
jgi:signal transduction histidine kinase